MNTAKYHVENLLDAGIIAVADTKYSVKGREVKLYSLTNQLLIVAPRQADLRSLLLKYAALFGIVALASLTVSAILPLISSWSATGAPVAAPAAFAVGGAERNEMSTMAAKAGADAWASSPVARPGCRPGILPWRDPCDLRPALLRSMVVEETITCT